MNSPGLKHSKKEVNTTSKKIKNIYIMGKDLNASHQRGYMDRK